MTDYLQRLLAAYTAGVVRARDAYRRDQAAAQGHVKRVRDQSGRTRRKR